MGVSLAHTRSLSISGIVFNVSSPDLPLYEDSELLSSRFRSDEPGGETVAVTVVRRETPPPRGELLFETASYRIYRSDDDRAVIFNPAAGPAPLWSATLTRARGRVDIAAGEGLVRTVKGDTFLEMPFRYPLDQLAVVHMLLGRGLLLHAAGAVIGGRGWVFAGPSGAGKTTVTRLFAEAGRQCFLSDDRIVVRAGRSGYEIWGTPWPGEAGTAVNEAVPLSGVFILGRGAGCRMDPLGAAEASRRIMPLVSVPWYDREELPAALGFLDGLMSTVPFYDLAFHPGKALPGLIEDFCGRQP